MATTSEVKSGLDAVALVIAEASSTVDKAQSNAQLASDALGAIPANFADLIATIDAYAPTGEFESLAKDEKDKLATEFAALKAKADAIVAQT